MAERGWHHQSHRSLYAAINTLEYETGDSELGTLFGVTGDLHTNFYENWYPEAFVKSRLRDIERFVNKVEALLSPLSRTPESGEGPFLWLRVYHPRLPPHDKRLPPLHEIRHRAYHRFGPVAQ